MSNPRSTTLSRRRLLRAAGAAATLVAAPVIGRAQGGVLKVGVLLPRSGVQASIGQDCQRGARPRRTDPEGPGLSRSPADER